MTPWRAGRSGRQGSCDAVVAATGHRTARGGGAGCCTRCTCGRSPTPTATGSATWAGSSTGSTTCVAGGGRRLAEPGHLVAQRRLGVRRLRLPGDRPRARHVDDLDRLIAEAGRRDIRVVMDLVPNHTSDQHPWFLDSRSSRRRPAPRLVRVGRPRARRRSPQQLGVELRGSGVDPRRVHRASTTSTTTSTEQPDLNWWNEEVRRGVRPHHRPLAGPRRGRASASTCATSSSRTPGCGTTRRPPRTDPLDVQLFGQRPVYNGNRPEVHDVIRRWRRLADRIPAPC